MHNDIRRGIYLAQGAQVGRMLFKLKSFVLGVLFIGGGILAVSMALVLLRGGR